VIALVIAATLILSSCGGGAVATEKPAKATQAPEATEAAGTSEKSGATEAPAAMNRDPKTLVVAIYSNPGDLDPASSLEQIGNIIMHATYEGLVRVKAENINEIKPALAESWDHNDDFTSWTFHLRKDAKFHDGTPLDAEAVKFSIKRLVTIELGASYILSSFITDPDKEINVVDPYTIEFKFENSTPLLLKALSSGYGSFVVNPKVVAANEKDGDQGHAWLNTNIAGSGPYNMTEYTPNQQIILTRNEAWWGWDDKFHFDKIILKIVPERSTRRSLIETGDVDATFNLSPEDWEALKQNSDVVVDLPPGLSISYITLGNQGYLADPKVRQALNYAFDYEGFINGMWKGYSTRSYSILPGGMQCSDPDIFKYNTDLDKAKALLTEAGVPMDGSVTWLYWAEEGGGDMGAGLILQSQLQKLGINLKVEERDSATVSGSFYSDTMEGRPDMFRWGWWPDYNDPTDEAWVTIHTDAGGSNGGNGGFYSNAEVDKLIDDAANLGDEAKLCEMYKQIQNITTEIDPPWIYLAQRPDEMILRKDIGGYKANIIYNQTFQFQELFRIGY
jgi:peptide/nickel transport system substrate-binding protein